MAFRRAFLVLLALFATAQVEGVGPNFYVEIGQSSIGYTAAFAVAGGNPVAASETSTNGFITNPGGETYNFSGSSCLASVGTGLFSGSG
jgi:hypothetical protein